MAVFWIILLVSFTYLATISIVVVGQEVHPLLAVVVLAITTYGAYKLFQARLTRLS